MDPVTVSALIGAAATAVSTAASTAAPMLAGRHCPLDVNCKKTIPPMTGRSFPDLENPFTEL